MVIHRIYLTIDGKTDDLDASGACTVRKADKSEPFIFVCSAITPKGTFAAEFTGNHVRTKEGGSRDAREAAR